MTTYSTRDDELIEVVRETVHQLEVLTRRLQSYVEKTVIESPEGFNNA